jgi:hypothetical protein
MDNAKTVRESINALNLLPSSSDSHQTETSGHKVPRDEQHCEDSNIPLSVGLFDRVIDIIDQYIQDGTAVDHSPSEVSRSNATALAETIVTQQNVKEHLG